MGDFSIPKFVKWAGGKTQLIDQLVPLLPETFNRYIEPFVGGGALLFYILQKYPEKKVIISDANEELINTYNIVKTDVNKLIIKLKEHKNKHNEKYYYIIRAVDPKTLNDVDRAARLIYLNRTCFNGLYRVNSKGGFNVPIGSYTNPEIVQEEKLKEISKLLQNVEIECESFEKVVSYAKKGDFIYLDPPYYPLDNKPSFTTYHHDAFLDDAHKKLAEVFITLDKKGCLVMESNSNTAFVKKLYPKYDTKLVNAKRLINCRSEGRGIITEIVIRNY